MKWNIYLYLKYLIYDLNPSSWDCNFLLNSLLLQTKNFKQNMYGAPMYFFWQKDLIDTCGSWNCRRSPSMVPWWFPCLWVFNIIISKNFTHYFAPINYIFLGMCLNIRFNFKTFLFWRMFDEIAQFAQTHRIAQLK